MKFHLKITHVKIQIITSTQFLLHKSIDRRKTTPTITKFHFSKNNILFYFNLLPQLFDLDNNINIIRRHHLTETIKTSIRVSYL